MNLTDMRALVRTDLHDEDAGNYVWTNDELDRHIEKAAQEYSYAVPVETTYTSASLASRDIDISGLTTRIIVYAVEYPEGEYPPVYVRFSIWGDTLTVLVDTEPDGTYDAKIYYGKMRTLAGTSDVLPHHERLIAMGAAGFACSEWSVYAANRVNVGGAEVMKMYRDLASSYLANFRLDLRRLGRINRVRTRQLYSPTYPPVSKTIVEGP